MDIKPIFNTQTIKITKPASLKPIRLEKRIVKDPSNKVPNGIYKVIHFEKIRQSIYSFISGLAILVCVIFITLFATTLEGKWSTFIIPGFVCLLAIWKFFNSIITRSSIQKSISRYKENLELDITTVPPFIPRLYLQLNKSQVHSNWFTTFIIFYGGLFTLILWWLKSVSWWIFDFKKWIASLFVNPSLMTLIFAFTLLATFVLQIIFTIYRRKRILEINAYFGNELNNNGQVDLEKANLNKMYRRIFIVSIMLLLVFPLLIKALIKIIKRK